MPGRFNPNEYETVKERKKKFYADHPNGCIHVELLSPPERAKEYVLIRASIWRDAADKNAGYPPDAQGMSLSIAGGKGADADAWTENAEESAVGRALDNLGYAGNNKCSREEMEKAQRHAEQRKAGQAQASTPTGDKEKALEHLHRLAESRGLDADDLDVLAYVSFELISHTDASVDELRSIYKALRRVSDEELRETLAAHRERYNRAREEANVA